MNEHIPSLQEFQAWAAKSWPLAEAVLLATAAAKVVRADVDAIQRAILAERPLPMGAEYVADYPKLGGMITDPKHVFLCDDAAARKAYYAECDRRERAAGVKPVDMPATHCPALSAETRQLQAENALIGSGMQLLLRPGQAHLVYGQARAKLLALCMQACVQAHNEGRQ